MLKNNYFQKFLDLDWTKMPYIFFLISIYIISRIPLINTGFGSDPDAWRIANSAFDLKNFFHYEPSRFPGYPLPEYINSLIIDYGWIATNTLTLIISLISVIVFAMILNELNIKNKGLIVVTYAFFPILWINSVSTMDYMWALTFIIISWYFIIKKRYVLAGLMMGLAIGSRPTSLFLIIPFIYLIYRENLDYKKILYFLVMVLITSIILFLPLYITYGLKFITFYPSSPDIGTIWSNFSEYFGVLSIILGLFLIIYHSKDFYRKIFNKKDYKIIFLVVAIFSILIPFLMAPYEIEYLIPLIPFGLVLLSQSSKKSNFFIIFCILIILNAFVGIDFASSSEFVDDGFINKEISGRNALLDINNRIVNSDIENSVIISSEYLPFISYLYESSQENPENTAMKNKEGFEYLSTEKNVQFVYLASLEEIKNFQNEEYNIYYIGNTALRMTNNIYGYDLNKYNCSNIFDII
ncbi:hypothetical protein [Methanobacterium movens]